jgi:hypothetical protein
VQAATSVIVTKIWFESVGTRGFAKRQAIDSLGQSASGQDGVDDTSLKVVTS